MSDFSDYFRGRISQSIAATVLLFFANITNIITFGAVMERALHHQMVDFFVNLIWKQNVKIIFNEKRGQINAFT